MHLFVLLLLLFITVCIIAGHVEIILFIGARVLLVLSALLVVFFLICLIRLLFMRRKPAHFTRIDYKTEDSLYQVAFYQVGDKEYPCIFPEEGVFRNVFYNPERKCHVFLDARKGVLFDPVSLITIFLGFFAGLTFGTVIWFLFFI